MSFEHKYAELDEINSHLTDSIHGRQQAELELNEVYQQHSYLADEAASEDAALRENQETAAKVDELLGVLRSRLKEESAGRLAAETDVKRLKEQLEKLQNKFDSVTRQRKELEESTAFKENELNNLRQQHEEESRLHHSSAEEKQALLATIDQWRNELANETEALNETRAAQRQMDKEVADLKQQFDAGSKGCKALKAQNGKLQLTLENTKKKLDATAAQHQDSQQSIEDLSAQHKDLLVQIEIQQDTMRRMQAENAELKAAVDEWRNRVGSEQSANTGTKSSQSNVTSDLEATRQQWEEDRARAKMLSAANKKLRMELQELQRRAEDTAAQTAKTTAETQLVTEKLQELRVQDDSQRHQLPEQEQEQALLKQQITEAQMLLADEVNKRTEAQAMLQSVNAQAEEERKLAKQLELHVQGMLGQNGKLKDQAHKVAERVDQERMKQKELQKLLESANLTLSQAESQKANANQKLEEQKRMRETMSLGGRPMSPRYTQSQSSIGRLSTPRARTGGPPTPREGPRRTSSFGNSAPASGFGSSTPR